MELYQLKTFQMVAEEGHLTRAAKRLYISQPAVSAHIKMLEEELGVVLFYRTPKGMVLTHNGLSLKERADKVLAIVGDMKKYAVEQRNTLAGLLKVGINTEPEYLRIPELFSSVKERFPNLRLHLLQSMTGEVLNRLEDGTLDAGFMYGENASEKIITTELERFKMVVAGPIAWKERLESADIYELAMFPWILTPTDCPFHTVTSQLFNKYGLQPSEAALVDQESTIMAMILASVGISLVFERDTRQHDAVDKLAIWDKEDLFLDLSLACLEKRMDDPKIQALLAILCRIWQGDFNGRINDRNAGQKQQVFP